MSLRDISLRTGRRGCPVSVRLADSQVVDRLLDGFSCSVATVTRYVRLCKEERLRQPGDSQWISGVRMGLMRSRVLKVGRLCLWTVVTLRSADGADPRALLRP